MPNPLSAMADHLECTGKSAAATALWIVWLLQAIVIKDLALEALITAVSSRAPSPLRPPQRGCRAGDPGALQAHSRNSIQIEVVFQLHVHRYGLAVTHRRHKTNLTRCGNRFFRQPAAKFLHRLDVGDLSAARENHTQNNRTGNLLASGLFRVLRLGLGDYARTRAYFR